MQEAIIQQANGLGQLAAEALTHFAQKHAGHPLADQMIRAFKDPAASPLEAYEKLQQGVKTQLDGIASALDPARSRFAAHPNLVALKSNIESASRKGSIMQPMSKAELAQQVTEKITDSSQQETGLVGRAADLRVVEMPNGGYMATGTVQIGQVLHSY
jgi:hypothetical protein